ncbi:MAG: hypothetical protein GTO62_04330 [Planctomycetales bacterium]|nr:hypothetical protein [Planctomycetales bacterium]NIP68484.1 hypothetical protein [Planctomycetales bacterium]
MKVFTVAMLASLGAVAPSSVCQAMYLPAVITTVPVERLVKNMQAKVEKQPKNPHLLFGLARIHSMAYAVKSNEIKVAQGEDGPWIGKHPLGIPYEVSQAEDEEALAAAKAHLQKALDLHKSVVELKPDHYLARLGLAWCTEQAGNKEEAIRLYRALIQDAVPIDRKIRDRYDGVPTISTEASTYLIQLLDPTTDAGEIATLKKQSEAIEQGIARWITPVAVALDRDLQPDDFVDHAAAVRFDLDGSGIRRRWQWINRDTAWLVYDHQGTGQITSALQMFGSVTFWLFWSNGYDAMSSLDDNSDGKLNGSELRDLALWHDRNQNGISEPGEVRSLADHGIVELDCTFTASKSGLYHNPHGVTFSDGHTRPSCDVILQQKR